MRKKSVFFKDYGFFRICSVLNAKAFAVKKFSISALFFCLSVFVFAEYNSLGIPDSAEIRAGLLETWFEAPLSIVRNNNPELHYNKIGQEFQVRMEETELTYDIFVAAHSILKLDVYSDNGIYTKEQDIYPRDVAGSWVLIKNKKNDKPIRIRYYFLPNSEVYIQFSPYNRTSTCDLVVFGNYAVRGVPTGVPFEKFYTASFEDVQKITKNNVPWNFVLCNPDCYHSIKQMAAVIREKLPEIVFDSDSMIDENGDYVDFATGEKLAIKDKSKKPLSSMGFLKWVADGLVEPLAGGKLKRYPLLAQTVEIKETGYQGVLSQKYSLSIGLDFVRNLSSAVISVMTGNVYKFNESGVDVTIEPFATGISENGVENTVTFIKDSGYNVNFLKSLLYVLANIEPETFYFCAVRQTDDTKTPEIKMFNNCVILMPYFETNGIFNCYVFMDGKEMSLSEFIEFYKDDFIYLTRVRSSDLFFPD